MITSKVGAEVMLTAILVNTIVEGFTATSLYKNMGKPNYTPTKENHQLLTVNVA